MRRTVMLSLLAAGIVIAIAVAMVLIDSPLPTPAGGLAGTSWRLVTMNGRPAQGAGEPVSLGFQQDGRAGGSSGCNSYGGEYAVSGSSLTISGVVSTMRACADQALNEQESAYYAALASVASYELAGGQLTLRDAAGAPVLVLSAA